MFSRISQEVLEVVLAQDQARVRVTQEVLEIVVAGAPPPSGDAFVVEAQPRVRWLATVPGNEFAVRERPRVVWGASAEDTQIRFTVHTAPIVIWDVGPGTASTKCVSATGAMPPPDEPAGESTAQNYVF